MPKASKESVAGVRDFGVAEDRTGDLDGYGRVSTRSGRPGPAPRRPGHQAAAAGTVRPGTGIGGLTA